ncbi:hypothetical protein [Naasia sp. SYSU D00057]|uniref:hypothetical protein n=1 Tax=Naasia sp. SYSU D00057 TaxID=2817380 RepID=UPI001B314BAA|nr:hypothetical protein [Naasia sp. SYSU D00057]
MSRQLTVGTAPAPHADTLAAVVTLPESLRRAGDAADVVGVLGIEGWPRAAADAIRSGARGVLVTEPVAADVTELTALAGERSVPVVLDSLWAPNPAVGRSAPSFALLADERALIEARVDLPVGSDLDQAALDVLALLRRATGPVTELDFVRHARTGWDAVASFGSGASGMLSVILTDSRPASAAVRIVKPADAVELTVPAPDTAAPGRAVVSGPDGETLLVTAYESAHRAAWRRLHGLVLDGVAAPDLEAFAADVRVLAAARGRRAG